MRCLVSVPNWFHRNPRLWPDFLAHVICLCFSIFCTFFSNGRISLQTKKCFIVLICGRWQIARLTDKEFYSSDGNSCFCTAMRIKTSNVMHLRLVMSHVSFCLRPNIRKDNRVAWFYFLLHVLRHCSPEEQCPCSPFGPPHGWSSALAHVKQHPHSSLAYLTTTFQVASLLIDF